MDIDEYSCAMMFSFLDSAVRIGKKTTQTPSYIRYVCLTQRSSVQLCVTTAKVCIAHSNIFT